MPVKPINQFMAHWQSLVERVLSRNNRVRVGVVGAGAGGVEILLAAQYRLRQELRARGRTDDHIDWSLFCDTGEVLPDHNPRARRAFDRVLRERGVQVFPGDAVAEVSPGRLVTAGRGTRAGRDPVGDRGRRRALARGVRIAGGRAGLHRGQRRTPVGVPSDSVRGRRHRIGARTIHGPSPACSPCARAGRSPTICAAR